MWSWCDDVLMCVCLQQRETALDIARRKDNDDLIMLLTNIRVRCGVLIVLLGRASTIRQFYLRLNNHEFCFEACSGNCQRKCIFLFSKFFSYLAEMH